MQRWVMYVLPDMLEEDETYFSLLECPSGEVSFGLRFHRYLVARAMINRK